MKIRVFVLTVGKNSNERARIRVSGKERTFVECLDRVEYARAKKAVRIRNKGRRVAFRTDCPIH